MDESFKAIEYKEDALYLIDQRVLPATYTHFICTTVADVEFAIRDMVVRGAPAIGATAAYGVFMAAKENANYPNLQQRLKDACDFLAASRPTAVNLEWAVERMYSCFLSSKDKPIETILHTLKKEADEIKHEDIQVNKQMSKLGNQVIPQKATILTHCNTGALATAGWGTALGVIKEAFYAGKDIFVYADETRPRLQGARLTAWELTKAKIPSALIADSAAATLLRDGKIDLVILGGDRVAANGDVANKVGTLSLSVLCKEYGVPFYAVVPISTIDFNLADGSMIPIEERDKREISFVGSVQVAPQEMAVYNPAFDVTPHQNITGIITERGIIRPPYKENIERLRKGEML